MNEEKKNADDEPVFENRVLIKRSVDDDGDPKFRSWELIQNAEDKKQDDKPKEK